MPQNARIRDEWIESPERIEITSTESDHADPEQHVRICGCRISDGFEIGLTRFAKHERPHISVLRGK
jgi:hypothetical protein